MTVAADPIDGLPAPAGRSGHARSLVVSLVAVTLVAGFGSVATRANQGWFDGLDRPAGTPPGWAFGPVWTLLYIGMAVAAWLVWRAAGGSARVALALYVVQLALNAAWSPMFFGAHAMGTALLVIAALNLAVAATIRAFAGHSRRAALLLVPYAVWVGYATYLNAGFLALNG